jgi:hypothetical protein
VEHACPRCNSSVEDSSPFCQGCGAAQVRFSAQERQHDLVSIASGTGSAPVLLHGEAPAPKPVSNNSYAALRSALYAGLIVAFLSSIPLGPAFIFALPIGGFLCLLFYRRSTSGPEPVPRVGFKLGALTGLFAFLVFLVLTAVGTLTQSAQNELREAMLQNIKQVQERTADPQARQMLDYFTTPQGMAFMMGVGFVFMGVIFVLLSGLGGAISASLLRRKDPPGQ